MGLYNEQSGKKYGWFAVCYKGGILVDWISFQDDHLCLSASQLSWAQPWPNTAITPSFLKVAHLIISQIFLFCATLHTTDML